jgi:hypothetical protein
MVQFQNCYLSVTKLPQSPAMIEEDRRMELAVYHCCTTVAVQAVQVKLGRPLMA